MSFAFTKLHNIFSAVVLEGLTFLFILGWNGDVVFMMAERGLVLEKSGKYTEYLSTAI